MGGIIERQPGSGEALPDHGDEELLLRAEQLEHVWLRDANAFGDGLNGRTVQPVSREFGHRCGDDLLAAFVGSEAGGGATTVMAGA